jgi:leucyl aminopeptidase (aminopeptidase T)
MMPPQRTLPSAGVIAALLCAGGALADDVPVGDDPHRVAQRLAAAAAMRQGDLVLLSGSARDAQLLEQLAAQVRGVGAHPVLALDTERTSGRPRSTSVSATKPEGTVMAAIIVEFGEKPAALVDVPARRLIAPGSASSSNERTFYSRSLRQVHLENDLYPTKSNAEIHGILQSDLAKTFWEAVALDPAGVPFSAHALRSALVAGKELRISHTNGTDLKLRVDGRPVYASDGAIARSDLTDRGGGRSVWLPAGEVYLVPVPGSAEGTVVVDRQVFQGKDIEGLALAYKAGKLTSMTAASGLEPLKAIYNSAGPGKDLLGVIDIGINPDLRASRSLDVSPAGMVTLYLGNNVWAGGSNSSSFGLGSRLLGSTVTLDGNVIVENGALKGHP